MAGLAFTGPPMLVILRALFMRVLPMRVDVRFRLVDDRLGAILLWFLPSTTTAVFKVKHGVVAITVTFEAGKMYCFHASKHKRKVK
jgi:hypothetical protein